MSPLLKPRSVFLFSTTLLIWLQLGQCWNINPNPTSTESNNNISRRKAIATATATFSGFVTAAISHPSINNDCHADDVNTNNNNNDIVKYEFRDRFSNKGAIIREDYYYMMGSTPPRNLRGPLRLDDPEWNAFGSCTTKEDGSSTNSCTYVSVRDFLKSKN